MRKRVISGVFCLSQKARLIVTIAILTAGIYLLFLVKPIMKLIYPFHYEEIVFEHAQRFELDPYLIAALIHVESKWNTEAVSAKGATGLMQLMPETAAWISERTGIAYQLEVLKDPELNIMLGCWYLDYLRSHILSLTAALAAYNGGQGNVQKWLSDKQWDGTFAAISDIPFRETRVYMQRIAHTWGIYQKIYQQR